MYARFDEIPSMTLKDIKNTKRNGWTDNVKTVYPPTKTVCGGYNQTAQVLECLEDLLSSSKTTSPSRKMCYSIYIYEGAKQSAYYDTCAD